MGAGFVIFLWLIVVAAYLGILAVFAVLFLIGWFKKWRWLTWPAAIPIALMAVLAVMVCSVLIYGVVSTMNPRSVYESTFSERPSTAVSGIKSSVYWFADTGSIFLKFQTSEKGFRRLLPSHLSSTTWEKMVELANEQNAPEWWNFTPHPGGIYFFREHNPEISGPGPKGFYYESEYYAFDPVTQTAYFRFIGID